MDSLNNIIKKLKQEGHKRIDSLPLSKRLQLAKKFLEERGDKDDAAALLRALQVCIDLKNQITRGKWVLIAEAHMMVLSKDLEQSWDKVSRDDY